MIEKATQVAAILCTAVAMAAGLAHLLELPHKIDMSREHYLLVQQLYAGWALLGIVVVAALLSSGVVTWLYRRNRAAFRLALAATALVALGLLVFFVFTFPTNQATENWTVLPEGWEALRARWEYSHAVAATLNFLALASLSLAVIERRGAR